MQQTLRRAWNRLTTVGSPDDALRATTVALADFIMLGTVTVSRFMLGPVKEFDGFWMVVVLLGVSTVLALWAGDWLLNLVRVLRGVGEMASAVLRRDQIGSVRISIEVGSNSGALSFYTLVASVLTLPVALVYLVYGTGGVKTSPFLQFILTYAICGVLVAGNPRTKLLLLAASASVPLVLLRIDASPLETEYSDVNVAVLASVATFIAGLVNFVTSKTDVRTPAPPPPAPEPTASA